MKLEKVSKYDTVRVNDPLYKWEKKYITIDDVIKFGRIEYYPGLSPEYICIWTDMGGYIAKEITDALEERVEFIKY